MEKIDLLEEKIRATGKMIQQLSGKNVKILESCRKLEQENELLQNENKQVGKLLSELDRLREERKWVHQKCENLLEHFKKAGL